MNRNFNQNTVFPTKKKLLASPLVGFSTLIGLFALLFSSFVFGAEEPAIQIKAPNRVEVGAPIEVQVDVNQSAAVAGYELLVAYDKTAAEFGGVFIGDQDGMPAGREIIISDQLEQGMAFAVYSCEIAGCTESSQENKLAEKLETVTVRLLPIKEGRLEIKLLSARFVDAQGTPVVIEIPTDTIEVVVGDEEANTQVWPSTVEAWSLPEINSDQADAKANRDISAQKLDQNADGRLSFIDVVESTLAWKRVRNSGIVCDLDQSEFRVFDSNQDGCLDIADIQIMSTHPDSTPFTPSRAMDAELIFTVNSVSDDADSNIGNGICSTLAGECTLRAAILEANVQPGVNTIEFNIPGSGVQQIQLTKVLPTINDMTGGVIINGYSQPGATENTAALESNANILIEVRGDSATVHDGFFVTSSNNVIQGLSIFDMFHAINLYEDNAQSNAVLGNYIGTNAAGDLLSKTVSGNGNGIYILQGAKFNIVGTPNLKDRNVISGNDKMGIRMDHEGTNGNTVQNNIFGLNPSGTANLKNRGSGIDMQWGPSNNLFGGTAPNERNVFSGNGVAGFDFSHSQSTSNNHFVGNFVGTDLTGNEAFSWTANNQGLIFKDNPLNNFIYNNVISGNRLDGIWHKHNYTGRNYFYNNKIGLGNDDSVIGNGGWGMFLTGHDYQIGPNNIFAGNSKGGIFISNNLGGGANEPSRDSTQNHIFQNSFYDNNGLAIDIEPIGINANDVGDTDTGPNELLNFPIITTANLYEVVGTSCANCTVEIYSSDSANGKEYLNRGSADSAGNFTINVTGITNGQFVSALAIDANENTSEFSTSRFVTDRSLALETLIIPAVDNMWQQVNLQYSYDTPVIVCTVNYANNSVPIVTRLQQVTSTSFEIKLQNSGDVTVPMAENIMCLVVEQGGWVLPDGTAIEAQRFDSTVTSNAGSWVGEPQSYLNSYSNPVVLGQVMSYNDPNWSTFWSRGINNDNPPNSINLDVGLHVGEDANINRLPENIGFVVIEAGSGVLNGVPFQSYVSGDTIEGVSESPPYISNFPTSFGSVPVGAIASQAGMDGTDGSWAVLFGQNPLSASAIHLAVDEDQLKDAERAHIDEIVHILVFENNLAYQDTQAPPPTPTPTATPTSIPTTTATPTLSPTPTIVPTPANPGQLVRDSFTRNVATGWGIDELGSSYSHLWGETAANNFSVNGSEGILIMDSLGLSREAILSNISVTDSSAEITFSIDQLPAANSFIRLMPRHVNDTTTYRATLQISSSGDVQAFVDRLVNGSWAKVSNNQSIGLQVVPGIRYRFKVETTGVDPTTILMKAWNEAGAEPPGWQHIATDSTPALQTAAAYGVRVNISSGVTNTPLQFNFDDLEINDLATDPEGSGTGRLETITASIDGNWTIINFNQTYTSPVAACSIHYENNTVPVVVRMRNATADSVEIKLQNPGDLSIVVADDVSCLVTEEGVWTLPDGRKMEAGKINSTITDRFGSWTGQSIGYSQVYASPSVFGQVMTNNDSRWSVFWSYGNSIVNPASTTNLSIGKEVGEDPDTTRLDETIGYIILDSGQGTLETVHYEVATGADTVFDFSNPATYSFNSTFSSQPNFALVAQAGMDGGNGGWAYLFGPNPISTTGLSLAIDEDQIADNERVHTNEQVSFLVFENPISITWGGPTPPGPTPTPNPTPIAVPLETFATDSFSRNMVETWGYADIGGIYTMLWGDSANDLFSINGNEGEIELDTGQNREVNLESVNSEDFDITFDIRTDVEATSNQDVIASGRILDAGSLYRLRVRLQPDGLIKLSMIKAVSGSWFTTQNSLVSGIAHQPNEPLKVRYQIVGANPTTLRAKVWSSEDLEPEGWDISILDSESLLQTSGQFGFKFINQNGSTSKVIFALDNLSVTNVTSPPAVTNNRQADVIWIPIPSQGMSIYIPIISNQSQIDGFPVNSNNMQNNE